MGWSVITRVLQSVLALVGSIIVVRSLGPDRYGMLTVLLDPKAIAGPEGSPAWEQEALAFVDWVKATSPISTPKPRIETAEGPLSTAASKALLTKGSTGNRHTLAVPAYEQVVKASHSFNLLDARGVISVQERQSYILRIRELAKACGAAWLQTEGGGS